MINKAILIIIFMIVPYALFLTITPKTVQSLTTAFNKYDENEDNILSKKQTRKYFDEEYMKDFQGIDIDPKFIESSFNYIYSSDKNDNGLELQEFMQGILPKKEGNRKTEPQFYPEQEL